VAKPNPQIFREACRLLSVSPTNCIYIGDQVDLDVEGSKSAGMTPIWLNREGTSTLNRTFKTVRSLLDIEI
jgi:putative hydrolase of the HAD superfamily